MDETALKFFRANVWLRDLPPEILLEMARFSYLKKFTDGQLFVARGQSPEGLCVVISGGLQNSTSSQDGREIVFSSVRSGSLWGIVSAVDGNGAAHDTHALGDSEFVIIPITPLHRLMDSRPLLYRHFSMMLCYRLRKAYSALDDLGLASLRQRLAHLLCTLFIPAGGNPDSGIAIPLTQGELALRVGATRSSVNREIQEMRRDGILDVGYGEISVLDYQRLHALCATKRIFDR